MRNGGGITFGTIPDTPDRQKVSRGARGLKKSVSQPRGHRPTAAYRKISAHSDPTAGCPPPMSIGIISAASSGFGEMGREHCSCEVRGHHEAALG
jgi:hypothetical protein